MTAGPSSINRGRWGVARGVWDKVPRLACKAVFERVRPSVPVYNKDGLWRGGTNLVVVWLCGWGVFWQPQQKQALGERALRTRVGVMPDDNGIMKASLSAGIKWFGCKILCE